MAPEQQGDAPCAGQTHQSIDDPAQERILPAEDPSNQIKLKQADESPVQTADDGKKQCDRIHNITSVSVVDSSSISHESVFMQSKAAGAVAKPVAIRYNMYHNF